MNRIRRGGDDSASRSSAMLCVLCVCVCVRCVCVCVCCVCVVCVCVLCVCMYTCVHHVCVRFYGTTVPHLLGGLTFALSRPIQAQREGEV